MLLPKRAGQHAGVERTHYLWTEVSLSARKLGRSMLCTMFFLTMLRDKMLKLLNVQSRLVFKVVRRGMRIPRIENTWARRLAAVPFVRSQCAQRWQDLLFRIKTISDLQRARLYWHKCFRVILRKVCSLILLEMFSSSWKMLALHF